MHLRKTSLHAERLARQVHFNVLGEAWKREEKEERELIIGVTTYIVRVI